MPIIPPIAPAPTIQIFTRWFLITKGDWSAHRSRAGYPGFCKGALTRRLVLDRGEARDEKSVLNKLCVHPDFVISPPRCEFWCCAFLPPRRGRNRKGKPRA